MKNELSKKGLLGVTVLAAVLTMVNPCYAASQSVTFNVSCVIPTHIELAPSSSLLSPSQNNSQSISSQAGSFIAPQRTELGLDSNGSLVNVKTNLGENFRLIEENKTAGGDNTKLFTVTAL